VSTTESQFIPNLAEQLAHLLAFAIDANTNTKDIQHTIDQLNAVFQENRSTDAQVPDLANRATHALFGLTFAQQRNIQQLQAANQQLRADNQQLQADNQQLQADNQQQADIIEDQSNIIKQQEGTIARQGRRIEEDKTNLTGELRRSRDRVDEVMSEKTNLTGELRTSHDRIAGLRTKLDAARAEISNLTRELLEEKSNSGQLQNKYLTTFADKAALGAELSNKIADLQSQLNALRNGGHRDEFTQTEPPDRAGDDR
jgi:chromosome segregation ATPase